MMPGYQTSSAALTLPIQGMAAGPPVSSTTMVCGLAAASGERKASRPRISAVPSDTTAKLAIRQETQQLGEHRAALIHEPGPHGVLPVRSQEHTSELQSPM